MMDSSDLFRKEALESRQDDGLGRPGLIQPIPLRMAAWLGLAMTAVVLSYLFLGSYTHRIRLAGTVVPDAGIVRVFAPADGRIIDAPLQENTEVRRDDPIFTLDTGSETENGSATRQLTAQMRAEEAELDREIQRQFELETLAGQAYSTRDDQIAEEVQLYESELQSVNEHVAGLEASLERFLSLRHRGLGTDTQMQERKERIISQKVQLATLHRAIMQLMNERTNIETERKKAAVEYASKRSDLRRRLAQLRRERVDAEAGRVRLLRAPVDGTVTAIIAKKNEMVKAHDPVLSILPSGSHPEIHLFAPARAIGFLRVGEPVVLRYSAFPHEKFGQQHGAIKSISRVLMPGTEGTMQPLYRVIVAPDRDTIIAYGKAEPIRPGMTVEADILLDRRHLYEWILSPLIAMRNDVVGPAADHGAPGEDSAPRDRDENQSPNAP